MKKLLRFLTIALVTGACTCAWAVDYANHFYNQRVYRVALGSGTAPTAADMNLVRLHNGDMVLNTDDDVLYIMHATNVYTKITSAGAATLVSLAGVGDITGNLNVSGAITSATSKVTGNAIIGNGLTVNTNATIGGTLGVTGVATLTATPVLKDGLTVQTNATVGGTLGVTGVATFTATPVSKDGLTVGTNLTVGGVINGPFTIGTTNIAAGTLPTSIKASATNLNGDVPATDIAAGDLAGGVRASGTNLNGNVPATQIAAGDLPGGVRAATSNLNGTMTAANLTEATIASAIDGSAITNLTGTASANGTTLNALNLANCTNLPNAGIASVSATKLTAGTIATAIDGNAVTNIAAANVGTVAEGAAITNDYIVAGGTTNRIIMYPFGGGYITKSSTPL